MEEFFTTIFQRIDQLNFEGRAKKKKTAFFIQFFPNLTEKHPLAPKNRETHLNMLGFCEIGDLVTMKRILEYADGRVDYIFLDVDQKIPGLEKSHETALECLKKSELQIYSDTVAWTQALFSMILHVRPPTRSLSCALVGDHMMSYRLASSLLDLGYGVLLASPSTNDAQNSIVLALNNLKLPYQKNQIGIWDGISPVDILVGTETKTAVITENMISAVNSDGLVVDGGIGSLTASSVKKARALGIKVLRLDNRAAISSVVQISLEARDLVNNRMGTDRIAGISVVAGGLMGNDGDIVLDSINKPSTVIGIADGAGRIRNSTNQTEEDALQRIKSLIWEVRN